MFEITFWPGGLVSMALGALLVATLVQHLCHRRGFGAGLRLSGWGLGAAVLVAALLAAGEPYEEMCSGSDGEWSCSRLGPVGTSSSFMLILAVPLLVVWSVLYATALAACRLVYHLVVPRQRVDP